MGFEVFSRRSAPRSKGAFVTLQRKGTLGFNLGSYQLLGSPEAIELLYDPDEKLIGFRAVSEADSPDAYVIRAIGAGRTFIVSGTAFLNHYGIPHADPTRYDAEMVGDILTIDLKSGGRVVLSNSELAQRASEDRNGNHALSEQGVLQGG